MVIYRGGRTSRAHRVLSHRWFDTSIIIHTLYYCIIRMCKILNKERRRKGLQTCRRASSLRMVANSSTSIDRMVWKVEKKDDVEDDDAEERLRVDRRAIPLMSWRSIETLKRRKRSRAVIHWLVSQRGRWRRRIKLYLGIVYSILCTVFERGLRNTSISKDPNPSKITLFLFTLWGKRKKKEERRDLLMQLAAWCAFLNTISYRTATTHKSCFEAYEVL